MPIFAHPSLLASGSVVDLDGTFLIQWGIFLLFFVILRSLVWKPFLELLNKREEETRGRKRDAELAEENAKQQEAAYQEQYRLAQNAATERRAELLEKSLKKSQADIDRVRAEVARLVAEQRAEIQKQSEEARVRMKSEASQLAHLVCERILGRKVTS